MVDFALNMKIAHGYRLMELRGVMEEIAVIRFMSWEIWVIYKMLSGYFMIDAKKANILGCQRLRKTTRRQECVRTQNDHSA